jgi:hypothetical protein
MIRLAAIVLLWATASTAAPCHDKAMLEAFLKHDHGLRLHSRGLSDAGNMLELWTGPVGHWAVVTTTPVGCASVDMPHKLRGRLWTPPSPNHAIPPDARMNEGQGL